MPPDVPEVRPVPPYATPIASPFHKALVSVNLPAVETEPIVALIVEGETGSVNRSARSCLSARSSSSPSLGESRPVGVLGVRVMGKDILYLLLTLQIVHI
jgi:uncharacterized ParB-like nuclease family protein